jgi:hypothetical protein
MIETAFRRKPLALDFDSMVYRLLEAKFSAETASGVGRRTTVVFKRPGEHDFMMWFGDIRRDAQIRADGSDPSNRQD